MDASISDKTVIALPYTMCVPTLSEAAVFCLETAKKNGYQPDEIWIIGDEFLNEDPLTRWFPDATIHGVRLDQSKWPQDIGSNQFLQLPMTLYAHLRDNPVAHVLTPLRGGSAYFSLMGRLGGLLPPSCKITQTCYLPRIFETEGALILPSELSEVLDSELEVWCARKTDALWVSHACVGEAIAGKLALDQSRIKALALKPAAKPARTSNISNHHIVFAGVPSPLYGFDAFLDLAESLAADEQASLKEISVFLSPSPKHITYMQAGYKRLRTLANKMDVKLNWHRDADIYEYIRQPDSTLPNAVLICPMRTPVFPLSARAVHKSGMQVIWGTGFTMPNSPPPTNVTAVVSDVRKIKSAVLKLWGVDNQNPDILPPKPLLPAATRSLSKTKRPSPKVNLLSIVVLHHNRPVFLDQCFASLAAQTDLDFELVLVDDGSTSKNRDKLAALVAKHGFKNAQISLIENSYPSAARNHGVAISKGDAVMFMDDDNVLAPQTVAAFKSALKTQDVVLSFYQAFSGNAAPEFTAPKTTIPAPEHISLTYGFAGLLPGVGLFYNLVGNSCFMMRKDLFIELDGFSSKFGVGLEDYAFLLKAAMRGDLRYVVLPEPYLHFRLHGDKIRNSHVDWRSPQRLQAGHWRVIDDMAAQSGTQSGGLPPTALAYARQLHELTQYQYVHKPRPNYFRLRSIFLHQYVRPFLARHQSLRRLFLGFADREGRSFRILEKWLKK